MIVTEDVLQGRAASLGAPGPSGRKAASTARNAASPAAVGPTRNLSPSPAIHHAACLAGWELLPSLLT